MTGERENRLTQAGEALALLFSLPGDGVTPLYAPESLPQLLDGLFRPESFVRYANYLYRKFGTRSLTDELTALLFDHFIENRILPAELQAHKGSRNATFLLEAARKIFLGIAEAEKSAAPKDVVFPAALDYLAVLPKLSGSAAKQRDTLAQLILKADRFLKQRSFRYDGRSFLPAAFDSVKKPEQFFGFASVRHQFRDHFRRFARGEHNLPLLVHSLPGHGKTSMVLSYALAEEELTVILADPVSLDAAWEALTAPLAARPDRKFVLFFDDIDPAATDWFNFRTNVGGAFSLPINIMPVLSSNYEFPANILSRGRHVSYPVFDELRCCEMVEDFLGTFGVKHYHRNLISQIAAVYTEEFGQKKFTELSPRTLVRYLDIYKDKNKRKTIVNLATGPMVTRPDAQLFYDFNIELMRSLYGEEYIKRLLKQRLDDLAK